MYFPITQLQQGSTAQLKSCNAFRGLQRNDPLVLVLLETLLETSHQVSDTEQLNREQVFFRRITLAEPLHTVTTPQWNKALAKQIISVAY